MRTAAAIYVRQSTTREGDRNVSPEDQEKACRALSAVQACDSVEVYRDLNQSGQDAKREAFQRMVSDLMAGKLSVVAAYDPSRIHRENETGAKFMNLFIANAGIVCVFADGSSFDTSANGEFEWALRGALNRKTARESGEKLSRAHAHMREQGYSTGPAAYGYRYDRTAGRSWPELVIDPDTAPIVERIFDTYAEGASSAGQIAQALKDESVAAPVSNRNRRNPKWSADIITAILANPAYIAEVYVSGRAKRKGQRIAARWQALVSKDVFQRVRDRMASKARGRIVKQPHAAMFTGLLWCQKCGRKMSPSHFPTETYYRCGSKDAALDDRCSFAHKAIRESELVPDLEAIFSDFLHGIPASTPAVSIESAKVRIAKFQKQLVRVGERYEADEITRDEWTQKGATLRGEIARLEAESAAPVDPVELLTLGQQWDSGDVTQRAAVLNALWQRIEIRADENAANGLVIVKLTPRADRAANAHALVMAARQYAQSVDDEYTPDPNEGKRRRPRPDDGGPGATLNTGRAGMDGNRTHPGRLSSAPQTVLKTAGSTSPRTSPARRC